MSKANVGVARSKIGKVYPLGCTGFVAQVLGQQQKHSSKWTFGAKVSINNLNPGDVVGWSANSQGKGQPAHVVIYVGDDETHMFLNCPGPNQSVKWNKSMGHTLYRVTY